MRSIDITPSPKGFANRQSLTLSCKYLTFVAVPERSSRGKQGNVYPGRLSENSNFLSDRGKLEKITGGIYLIFRG
jgi:hypothetical protein